MIATRLVALVYLGVAGFYISSYDMIAGMYRQVLGYPTYIIWPLTILKITGCGGHPLAALGDVGRLDLCGDALSFRARLWRPCRRGRSRLAPALVTWVLLIVSWLTTNRVRAVKSAYAPDNAAAVGT